MFVRSSERTRMAGGVRILWGSLSYRGGEAIVWCDSQELHGKFRAGV